MADFYHIKCKNQWKTYPNRRNFALCEEIWVGEQNVGVRIYAESSQNNRLAHAQKNVAENGGKCN